MTMRLLKVLISIALSRKEYSFGLEAVEINI